ncbi:MAG TPA: hypothetical protein VNN55_10695 [bacterium]|nr:hypothetical protein [bacterium]
MDSARRPTGSSKLGAIAAIFVACLAVTGCCIADCPDCDCIGELGCGCDSTFIGGGGGGGDPIIDVDCCGMTAVSMHISGETAAAGRVVWAAIESNGQIFFPSPGTPVPAGAFRDVDLEVSVPRNGLPPGEYNVVTVLSDGMGAVGSLSSYLALGEPKRVTIPAWGAAGCIDCPRVLYGDTLKLKANAIGVGGSLVISPRGPGEASDPGVAWTVLNTDGTSNGDPNETQFLVNLGNGDFYPLKPENGTTRKWRVRATLGRQTAETSIDVDPNVLLGTEHNEYDALIIQMSAEYGVPPTLSKAQIYEEDASFNPSAYAYELEDFDYKYIAVGSARGARGSALDEYPYNQYNMAVGSGWPEPSQPQGDRLRSDDIAFRARYVDAGTDANMDGFITAYEVYFDPDNTDQGLELAPRDFVAQTPMAGSYGLKQLWWEVTLHPLAWNRGDGGNPADLVSPSLNIAFGTQYLRWMFDSHTDDGLAWNERWKQALNKYNGGSGSSGTGPYGHNVYGFIDICRPH